MNQLQLMRKKMLMKKKNQPNSQSKISNHEQLSNHINEQFDVTPFQNPQHQPIAQNDQQGDVLNEQISQQKGEQFLNNANNDPERQKRLETPELGLSSLDVMRKKLLNVKKTQTKPNTYNNAEQDGTTYNQYRRNQALSDQFAGSTLGFKQNIINQNFKERIQSLQIPKAACIQIHDKKLAKNNKILLKQLSKLQSNILTLNKLVGNQCQGQSYNLSLKARIEEEHNIPILSQKIQGQIRLMVGLSNKINTMMEERKMSI